MYGLLCSFHLSFFFLFGLSYLWPLDDDTVETVEWVLTELAIKYKSGHGLLRWTCHKSSVFPVRINFLTIYLFCHVHPFTSRTTSPRPGVVSVPTGSFRTSTRSTRCLSGVDQTSRIWTGDNNDSRGPEVRWGGVRDGCVARTRMSYHVGCRIRVVKKRGSHGH